MLRIIINTFSIWIIGFTQAWNTKTKLIRAVGIHREELIDDLRFCGNHQRMIIRSLEHNREMIMISIDFRNVLCKVKLSIK